MGKGTIRKIAKEMGGNLEIIVSKKSKRVRKNRYSSLNKEEEEGFDPRI
jgi:hypothetical protein